MDPDSDLGPSDPSPADRHEQEGPEPQPDAPQEPPPPPDADTPPAAERLEPRVIVLWTLGALIQTVVIGGILWAIVQGYVAPRHAAWTDRAWIVAATATGLLLVWTLVGPAWSWAKWRFWLGPPLLITRHGVFFEEEKAIPISRMQHVDLTRGPVERLFGLATLVVHTAGTEGAVLRLPGLGYARACALRDRILRARGEDVV